jgi:hypothetical protein
MRPFIALVALSFALGGCTQATYCQMVHAETCDSSMPDPVYLPSVAAGTIVNVNGDHDIVNINHFESLSGSTTSVRVEASSPASPRAFDPNAARVSLHSVDLSSCRVDGAGGEGHARVTFSTTGDIRSVVIDAPRGLGQQAVACIGSRLGTAHIPAFDGEPVTAGVGYYVP